MIPYVTGGKQKVLSFSPYNAITLRMPGRHATDTDPIGGDFVVCVDEEDMGWVQHQFTHSDIFMDLENKKNALPPGASFILELDGFMRLYADIVKLGNSPVQNLSRPSYMKDTLHPQTFLCAVQCLAVAEHRRYARFEAKFGGRYLPFRFGAGIVEGLWTAAEAIEKQRRGRPGVEWLEKEKGIPILTKELISS
jgi:hypothetical protein